MIDKICDNLTNKIKNKLPDVDDERAEVINYGIHLLVGEIPKTFIFIAIAAILGVLKEFFITILIIFPYRTTSGGFHLKTHFGCIVCSSLFYCGIPYISKILVLNNYTKIVLLVLIWIFGMIMCYLYAPADTENVPILRKKDRKIKQMMSCAILTITLLIGIFIKNPVVSNIIILGMLIQSMMISRLAYKMTNNKYGHELYVEGKKEGLV